MTQEAARSGLRVLLVEDVEFNMEILRELLAEQGWRCRAATSGEAALDILATDRDFDIVLMDIGLPGMDGVETCRRIRQEPALAAMPILALTAETAGERDRLLAAGFDGYLEKTFIGEELHDAVTGLLLRQKNAQPREKAGTVPESDVLLRTDILLNTYGSLEPIRQLTRAFFSDTDIQIARLGQALMANDHQAVRACCHSIRGAAAVFAAPALAAAAENLGRQEEPDNREASLHHLQQEYGNLRAFIRKWLADPNSP